MLYRINIIKMVSNLYGEEEFIYEDKQERQKGLMRLMLRIMEGNDNVPRDIIFVDDGNTYLVAQWDGKKWQRADLGIPVPVPVANEATQNVSKVEIEHWDSQRYNGDGQNSPAYTCEIDDRRQQAGQVRITISSESGAVDDFMDVVAEVNTIPDGECAVPCLHVAFDADHLAFSVYQNGVGKLLLRLENGVQMLPVTLPSVEQAFILS